MRLLDSLPRSLGRPPLAQRNLLALSRVVGINQREIPLKETARDGCFALLLRVPQKGGPFFFETPQIATPQESRRIQGRAVSRAGCRHEAQFEQMDGRLMSPRGLGPPGGPS